MQNKFFEITPGGGALRAKLSEQPIGIQPFSPVIELDSITPIAARAYVLQRTSKF